jgi:four helix bundle protein
MKTRDLAHRTDEFGVAITALCRALPDGPEARRIRGRLAGSGTAVASKYRGACRARSRAEFIAKIRLCAEEAAESHMWLNMCVHVGLTTRAAVTTLAGEAQQLATIFVAAQRTAPRRHR